MKIRIQCIKISKIVLVLLAIILIEIIFLGIGILRLQEEKNLTQMPEELEMIEKVQTKGNQVQEPESTTELKEYTTMPAELKGYKVIGKIQIPKLNLDSCILAETNTKTLKVSVTKLYGPTINTIGNFCIAGHNYRNNKMFGGIKKLKEGDEIILTDTFGRSITYQVYQTYNTSPKDISCLEQNTQGECEITLITCTAGAIQRVIVKAIEVYD